MNIFGRINIGDSATWDDQAFTDTQGNNYTSANYTLAYVIAGNTQVPLTLNSTAKGTGWTTTLSTTQSAGLLAGRYYWSAYASKTGARVTAGTGYFDAKANLAGAAASFDGRSQAEKDLDAVTTEITARISGQASIEYTIGSRNLKKEPIAALIGLQDRLKMVVKRERTAQMIANGLGNPGKLAVRFK